MNTAMEKDRPKRLGGYLRKLARLERENERLREAGMAQLAKGAIYIYFDENVFAALEKLAKEIGAADVAQYAAAVLTAMAEGPPADCYWRVLRCELCENRFQSVHWAKRCPRCAKATAEEN